jgi:hypothetical protein
MKIAPHRTGFLLVALAALIPSFMVAGVSGKVSGTVTDQKTHEVLPGANVVLTGTGLGASTDPAGEYFILRVPPGVYTLSVTLLGYRDVTVKNVQVSIDQTTRINVELSEESVTLKDEIVITAERPPVQRDATSSTQFVDAKQIAALPVADAREGLLLQTGVFLDPIPALGGLGGAGRGEQRYAVRGGSQEEVKWFIDRKAHV